MVFFLIIVFAITLIYLALTERVKRFLSILIIQGALLFGIAFFHLRNIDTFHLLFILVETLLVKSIAIPIFLDRIRKRNNLDRLNESGVPPFVAIMIMSIILVFGFVLSHYLTQEHIQTRFFAVAISCVLAGMFFVITHRNVFTHLIGYLIIENGIFLMSLAVGGEMPALVNTAILLDILISVLALGIFINKVGDTFRTIDAEKLSKLKN